MADARRDGLPVLFAVIVLVVCCLIAANLILLICAAWVVLYASLIFLGFGGCRWTSDWAIGYWKTVIGIGVSLMTMQLVIGVGSSFLQELVQQTANSTDLGQMLALTVAVILLGVLAHRIPQMISGMVTGSGHNGSIGAMGLMSAIGAALAASSFARGLTGGAGAAAAAAGTAMTAHEKLMDRISAFEAAAAAGNGEASMTSP